jgi:methylenetetrahydrofolate reductase (NADPH)
MEQDQGSGNREARLFRAAKLICVLKGLGFSGVHLGGNGLSFDNVKFILDTFEELGSNWEPHRPDVHFPVADTWYLYPPARTGACGTKKTGLTPGRNHAAQGPHRITHNLLFSPPNLISRLFGKLCMFCSRTRLRTSVLRAFERWIKGLLFYCRMCGDCTLEESTYICPQSGCPKNLLNGPCGGSRNQTCEVFPDRLCFWVRVYNRLDPHSDIENLGSLPFMHPKNWALDQTSSWINFYNGTDYHRIKFDNNSK